MYKAAILSQISRLAFSLVAVVIVPKVYGVGFYGDYSILIQVLGLFIFIEALLVPTLRTKVHTLKEQDYRKYIYLYSGIVRLNYILIIFLVLVSISMSVAPIFFDLKYSRDELMLLTLIGGLAISISALLEPFLLEEDRFRIAKSLQIVFYVVATVMLLLVNYISEHKAWFFLFVCAVPLSRVLAIKGISYRSSWSITNLSIMLGSLVNRNNILFSIASALGVFNALGSLYLVEYCLGNAVLGEVGMYLRLFGLPLVVFTGIAPILWSKRAKGQKDFISEKFIYCVAMFCSIFIFFTGDLFHLIIESFLGLSFTLKRFDILALFLWSLFLFLSGNKAITLSSIGKFGALLTSSMISSLSLFLIMGFVTLGGGFNLIQITFVHFLFYLCLSVFEGYYKWKEC